MTIDQVAGEVRRAAGKVFGIGRGGDQPRWPIVVFHDEGRQFDHAAKLARSSVFGRRGATSARATEAGVAMMSIKLNHHLGAQR